MAPQWALNRVDIQMTGFRVVCIPNDRWYSGNYCVVKTEDGEYLIKRVNQQADQLILQSEAPGNPPILIPLKKVAGVYKIVWQKRH